MALRTVYLNQLALLDFIADGYSRNDGNSVSRRETLLEHLKATEFQYGLYFNLRFRQKLFEHHSIGTI